MTRDDRWQDGPFPLFALHDDPKKRWAGSVQVTPERAKDLNTQGYGIFHCVNSFTGRRLVANLTRINYWFCEIDRDVKKPLENWMEDMPLQPTWVVESKRGYHCYWAVEGTASIHNWKRIIRHGIVPALGADPKATDVLRLLRAPGYNHVKGEPFPVKTVWLTEDAWFEEQMLEAFPDTREKAPRKPATGTESGEGFWYRAARLDGREAIRRLSGHWSVEREQFAVVEQQNGNANIYRVDGDYAVSTGAWVNAEGVLFADGVGVAAWIGWYCPGDWGRVAIALREVFPELEDGCSDDSSVGV